MDSLFDILLGKSLSGGSGGGGGGGTDNYNALQNKPQINGTTLTGNKSLSDLGIAAATDIPTVNNGTLTIQKNGSTVNTFKANQASDVTVNITVPTTAADVSALSSSTKYAASLSLTINSSTYVVTGQLKDQDGNNLGSAQTIDLPLETMVVGGSYDDTNKKIVLTLKNGSTVDIPVADLVAGLQTELSATNKLDPAFIDYDSTHATVTEADKTAWSGKQDALTFDGTYSSSTNKAATVSTVTNAVNALDVTGDSSIAASKTIKSWSETDGKVSVTTQDISISASQAGLGNVTNDAQVKKISSSTAGDIVTWNAATGDIVADSGVSIETNTSFSASSDTKIPTSKAIAQNAAASTVLKGYTADAGTSFQTLNATDNIVDAFEKVQGNTLLNKTNILSVADQSTVYNIAQGRARTVDSVTSTVDGYNISFSGTSSGSSVFSFLTAFYPPKTGDYVWKFTNGVTMGGTPISVYMWDATANTGVTTTSIEGGLKVYLNSTHLYTLAFSLQANKAVTGTYSVLIISEDLWDKGFTDYQPYALPNTELTALEKQNQTNILSLMPTAYTEPTVSTQYGVTIGSGGYCRIGNICLISIRLTNTVQIPNGSNFAYSLPLPEADAGLGAGSSVVALACNKAGIIAVLTNDGNIANVGGSAIAANTTFVLTGAYLIKQS